MSQEAVRELKILSAFVLVFLAAFYLPLSSPKVSGAILVNELANVKPESPWTMIDLLHEALRGRRRLFTGNIAPLFNMTSDLLAIGEEMLRRSRVPRP